MLAVAALAGAAIACSTTPPFLRGDPDPGGLILAALTTAERAVPPDAQVTLHQEYEPLWDSCDGRADAYGWSDPIVVVQFTTDEEADILAADADAALLAQGWQHSDTSNTDPGPTVRWTRTVAGSTVATATLQPFPAVTGDGVTWELTAQAPPKGKRVSGC